MASESRMVSIAQIKDAARGANAASPRRESFGLSLLLRRRYGCSDWILAVEIRNESPGDIDTVSRIDQRHSAGIDDYVNAPLLGKYFERFFDVFLQGRENLALAFLVSSFRILALTLVIFLQLFERITLRLQRSLIDDLGCCLDLGNLILGSLNALLQLIEFGLPRLKLAIESIHQRTELCDTGFWIQKLVRIDQGYLALGHGPG